MDILNFVRVPYLLKVDGKNISLSALTQKDWITISSAIKQGFFELIDNDKNIKSIDKAKAKATYIVGNGEAINFAIYDSAGQAFALWLSAKKLHPEITQEEVQEWVFDPSKKIEILEYICAFPVAEKLPENVVLTDEMKEKLEEEAKKKD